MERRWMAAAIILVLAWLAPPEPGGAQPRPSRHHESSSGPAKYLGVTLEVADPVGRFGELVDQGIGLTIEGRLPVTGNGALSLRADGGVIVYGRERKTACLNPPIGCRIAVDLVTSNDIWFVGVGPELSAPDGAIRPYANASVGLSYFTTHSSLEGVDDDHSFANTRNFGDLVTALRLGGGIRARIRRGPKPLLLDFGVQYHRNGLTEYLREGDIVDHPDGSITIFPNRSEANLVSYRIGLTIGFP